MRSILVVTLVLVVATTPCSAQSPGMVELTAVAGLYSSKQSVPTVPTFGGCGYVKGASPQTCTPFAPPESKGAALMGARISVWLARTFALEGSLLGSPLAFDNPMFASVRGVLTFAPRSRLSAYAVGGPALVAFDQTPLTLGGVLGVGTCFHVVPSLALRAELERYLYAEGELGRHKSTFMTLGLSVALRHGVRDKGSDVLEH